MNVLNAIGNIGKDCELRFTPNGDPVAQFSFALQSGYGDKQVTTWINCNLWGKRAETLTPMLTVGTRIGITGELTNRPYKDKNGNEKYSLEVRVNDVTLLGQREGGQPRSNAPQSSARHNEQDLSDIDSDLPF